MVTQRTANPCTPVRFRLGPPATPQLTLHRCDPVQIQQVLPDLLRNAVEAVRCGERREIEIASARVGDEAEISVSATGPGLAPEVRERLFEPFVTTKEQGMGVELSICRGIVERHGGRVWAEVRDGGGTISRVRLSLAT